MPTWKADHFAFEVSDLDVAIDFYTHTLGLKLMFREVDEKHGEAFAFLELDGGNLELLQVLHPDPSPKAKEMLPSLSPHLAMGVDDLETVVQQLKEKDISIIKGPLEIPNQVKWFYITDPDYNVIEFVEWIKK